MAGAEGGISKGAFAAGSLTGFAVSWNLTNTGAIAPVLAHHYDAGLVAVGLLTSIAFFAELAVMIPGGRAIDRWGARRVALASLALCLLGNAVLLALPGLYWALFLRWLLGFGVGAGFVAGSIWIAEDVRGRTALGQGLFGGVSLAGAGVATAVVPIAKAGLGWRSPYLTGIVVTAMVFVLAVPVRGAAGRREDHETTPLRKLLARAAIARLGVVHTASFAFSVVVGNWIVTLLRRNLDAGYSTAGLVGGLTLVLGIAGRPLGGWAVRCFPRHAYLVLVGSLVSAAVATAALAASSSLALDAVAAATLGLASGVPFGAVVNAAARAFPRAPGEAIGAMNLYAVTAIIVATPLVGATFALPGRGRIGFASLAAITIAAAAAVPHAPFGRTPERTVSSAAGS